MLLDTQHDQETSPILLQKLFARLENVASPRGLSLDRVLGRLCWLCTIGALFLIRDSELNKLNVDKIINQKNCLETDLFDIQSSIFT